MPSSRRARARSRRAAGGFVLVAGVALAALMLLPAALGLHRYVITGGSMSGSIERGSIVYEREVPVSRLKVGDVITYVPPAGSHVRGRVTHRIAWIGSGADGRRVLRTKGDANGSADPWKFVLNARTQPRVVLHVPLAGYVLAALGVRVVRILVIGVPALLVAAAALGGLVRRPGVAEARG